ncbi:MAG TPA: putative Ig domain-containing protein [Candidatus Sulfopaludibacter sp.]|nr:putative Ig domain-containing protein [Candidatus Sulfopaludibacter sp.]
MKMIKTFLLAANLCLVTAVSMTAAVTFTITPPIVSNTYDGTITLSVSNVPTGDTVVVQKFLDLNTNGLIDGSDWLVQQFNMTDGQAGMVIGSVTNFNVPGDMDSTTGQITAKLNFQAGDFMQNVVGKYLFKLSSPVAHFSPITNIFTVTNYPYAQKFTGNVVSNGVAVPNAVVLLFHPNQGPVAGTVANNSGSYTIWAPVGTYSLIAFKSNYVCNFGAPPTLTLASGQTITTNLYLTNATSSISGRVVDANNSNIGLPGILIPAQSKTGGLMSVGFTDTNGNFTVGVQSGQWSLKADDTSLIVHGYMGLQNRTNVNAGATGVTIGVPLATALIYGSVKDSLGNSLPALDVYANDSSSNLYETDGYTDANGNYVLGVLGLGTSDYWWIQANSNNQLTNYVFSQETINGYINTGQAALQNFTGILATNLIIGNVTCNGTNIVGVGMNAWANINGTNYQANYVDTDTNGNYSFNVVNGSWSVSINCNGGSDSLDNILGVGNYLCPNYQTATINNNNATNDFIVQFCGGVQILTTNLPVGEVNVYYDQLLQASSCSYTFTWSLLSGSPPSWLNADFSTGEIYGTPTTDGTYNFTVQVTDGSGHSTNQALVLAISNAVAVTTTLLPNGTNGQAYSQQLQADGGVPFGGSLPYSWSLVSGSLPANLNLAANGLISGTVATTGAFDFNVQATDSLGGAYNQPLSLTINSQSSSLQISTISLPNATQNVAYNTSLSATGGQPPYTWSLAPGSASLPYYLSLSGSGVISGAPVSAGTSYFIAQVTDSTTATANQLLSLTVMASTNNPVVALNSTQFKNGQFQFTFNSAPATIYTLQVSTNLVNWASVSTITGSGGPLTVSDLTAGSSPRFYRVKVGQ